MNANKVEFDRFDFSESGRIHAILKETTTPLGLSFQGRPYIGRTEKIPNSITNRVRAYDYCDNPIGTFLTTKDAAISLFDRWKEFGCGAKILHSKMPYHVHMDCEVLVMAESAKRAEEYLEQNGSEWEFLIRDCDKHATRMTSVPAGWTKTCLLFSEEGNYMVTDALKLIAEQNEEIRRFQKQEEME